MATVSERESVVRSVERAEGAPRGLFEEAVLASNESLAELVESFSSSPDLSSRLYAACAAAVARATGEDDITEEEDPNPNPNHVRTVHAVAALLRGVLAADPSGRAALPAPLFEAAAGLHSLLVDQTLAQHEEGRAAQREIGRACELYWAQGRPRREELAGATVLHLLGEALGAEGRAADVRRAFGMRESLAWLELDDLPGEPSFIKYLLLHAAVHPRFLRAVEGRRLLAYLFAMPVPFADELHATVKRALPGARKSLLPLFGDVYLRAWKESRGEALVRLETRALQDLMHAALYARQPATAAAVRAVLHVLHENKRRVKGLDEAVHRLYRPIVWRARADAGAVVRRNHAAVFFDAFPVQDPGAPREEVADQLQRQFDCLGDMLRDEDAQVRATAVRGVCRVLGTFWSLIPMPVVKALVQRLVNDLAFDAAASGVRAAVFDGLAFLLEEHQSHAVARLALPQLAPLVHDRVESVRLAFVRLLQYVSTIRSIRFWDVVPLEQLMLRLAAERSRRVSRALVRLLLNSYFPRGKSRKTQLRRALVLMREHRAASKKFYAHAHEFVPLDKVCRTVAMLYRACAQALEHDRRPAAAGKPPALTTDDPALVEAVLETAAMLWLNVEEQLRAPQHSASLAFLHDTLADGALQQMLAAFTTEPCRMALLTLASRVPAASVPRLRDTFAPHLAGLPAGAATSDFAPAVACMLEWGRAGEVLDLVCGGLAAAAGAKQRGKKRRMNPEVAARVVQYVAGNAHLRELVFPAAGCEAYGRLLPALGAVVEAVRARLDEALGGGGGGGGGEADEAMAVSFEMFCKLHAMQAFSEHETAVAAAAADGGGGAATPLAVPEALAEALAVVSDSAAPAMLPSAAPAARGGGKRRRKAAREAEGDRSDDLPHRVVLFGARMAADLAAAGFHSADLASSSVRWFRLVCDVHGPSAAFAAEVAAPLYKVACHLAARAAAARDPAARSRLLDRLDEVLSALAELGAGADSGDGAAVARAAAAEIMRSVQGHPPGVAAEVIAVVLRPALRAAESDDGDDGDKDGMLLDSAGAAELGAVPAALLAGVVRSRAAVRAVARLARGPGGAAATPAWVRVLSALRSLGEDEVKAPAQRARFLEVLGGGARALAGGSDGVRQALDALVSEVDRERERCLAPPPAVAAA